MFVGRQLGTDLAKIAREFEGASRLKQNAPVLELGLYARQRGVVECGSASLEMLCEKVLYQALVKNHRLSNWAQPALPMELLQYAACDAAASLHIYQALATLPDLTARLSGEDACPGAEADLVPKHGRDSSMQGVAARCRILQSPPTGKYTLPCAAPPAVPTSACAASTAASTAASINASNNASTNAGASTIDACSSFFVMPPPPAPRMPISEQQVIIAVVISMVMTKTFSTTCIGKVLAVSFATLSSQIHSLQMHGTFVPYSSLPYSRVVHPTPKWGVRPGYQPPAVR
ncbi:hypothetical protein AB1Y20_017161 [Prymnesium parvum]|uniref:3'-5' exonuclease domain-containing protein n=1 Tax=Prymnesium parvum TaxID=97485 RepID=A0AB34IA83_PRYPA